MRIFRAALLVLTVGCFPGAVYPETEAPVEAYREASRLVLESRYAEAVRVLDGYIAEHPEEPLGYLLKAAVLQYEATDYDDFSREAEFRSLLDRAESLGERNLKKDSGDLWAHYAVNSAKCFRGVRMVSGGSFVRGVMASRSGASGMAWIRSRDSRFHDAYLCDGSYRFWKSAAARSMHVLPFVGDRRDEGIADVETAIRRGKLTGPVANTVLLEILLEYDSEAATDLGERLVARYPECRLFAWQLGEAYKKLGKFEPAVAVYSGLAWKYENDPLDDGSGRVRCWWKLAVLARDIGRTADCRSYCEKILDLGRDAALAKRQAARVGGAKKLLSELPGEQERSSSGGGQ